MKFTADFGMGMLNALNLGDVTNEVLHQLRPYEIESGRIRPCPSLKSWTLLAHFFASRPHFEILEQTPAWLRSRLAQKKKLKDTLNTLGKDTRPPLWKRLP